MLARGLQPPPHATRSLSLLSAAHKFMLPMGGRLIDDPALKCLDETTPLHLPYPVIALEYNHDETAPLDKGAVFRVTKTIVLCHELLGSIEIIPIVFSPDTKFWHVLPRACIQKLGYLDRSKTNSAGRPLIFALKPIGIPDEDYCDEIGALLTFLGAISCSNVEIVVSPSRRSGKHTKSVLPFDDYHLLQINLDHLGGGSGGAVDSRRSPREHLRRGHIRRYETGLRIWIQAAIVNAGIGAKIDKDYKIRAAQK